MALDDRIRRWADAATARLRGDAELRLGIRAALIGRVSILAEAIRRRVGSREKGVRLALSMSGPPAARGAALAASVAPLARRRARTRRLVLAVLVPAAVLVTLLVFGIRSSRVRPFPYSTPWDIYHPLIDMGELIPLFPKPVEPIDLYPNLTPEKDDGTSHEKMITNHLREAWKARPQDRALYAQFLYFLSYARPHNDKEIEAALREGEAIDPGNAFYPFIRCSDGLELDVRWSWCRFTDKNDFREIWSRDGLERDMAEVLRAIGKSQCRQYRLEAMSNWMRDFTDPRSFQELVRRNLALSIFGRILVYHQFEALALAAPRYARLLISEGRSAEALPYLKAWHPLILELADDADVPGDWIGIHWALGDIVRYSASFQDDPLFSEEAWRMGALAEALDQPLTAAEKKADEIRSTGKPDKRERVMGLMTLWSYQFDWPVLGNHEASFGRCLEHGLLDQVGILCAAAAGLLLLAGAALAAGRWRLRRGPKARPLLLLPGWKDLLRILGLSIALPAAAYFAYSRWSCIGGRELTLYVLADRFALELTLLGLAIFTLLLMLSSAYLRERCRRLRIDVPAPGRRWPIRLWWGALAAAGLACLATRDHPGPWPSFVALLMISVFTFAVGLRLGRILFSRGIHRFFHGTLARSLVPFLAAGLFLVGPVFQAALSLEERMLVRADPTIRVDPKEGLWTVPEAREVRRLKQEFRRAAAEAEALGLAPAPDGRQAPRTPGPGAPH